MISGRAHPSSPTIPLSARASTAVAPSPIPILQPSPHLPTLSTVVGSSANLVKPSFFAQPASSTYLVMMPSGGSSVPIAAPLLHSPGRGTLQQSYGGAPLLQLFLPPAPSPSPGNGPAITRDKVHNALLKLVQHICRTLSKGEESQLYGGQGWGTRSRSSPLSLF
ncbi:unnamed protein product [Spirodela intermedia]|uniref:Uncharacterized protein n=1 Tax=Spirodela intermedia TaxID=51605 RepID=A0A7I8JR47_SPIIN|nr:unnamed protein product [Spirodela intermedia]CAA6672640.1 unnamed protein product [Spirodela intermedia]